MNTVINNTKVTAEDRDAMPRQVATEMLTAPKAKMSNRMRKQCMMARATVYPSPSPITKVAGFDPLTQKEGFEFHYSPDRLVGAEVKLANRIKKLNFKQLATALRRSTTRRAILQKTYIRLHEDSTVEPNKKAQLEMALSEAAARIEQVQEAIEDEIAARQKKS